MGSPQGEDGRLVDEAQHLVTLSMPYFIGKHHVTRGQFARFVAGTHYQTDAEKNGNGRVFDTHKNTFQNVDRVSWRAPGFDQADDHPVVLVSRNDAVAFAEWLAKEEGKAYRLPTEAQWEFACRNDNDDAHPFNTGYTITTDQANFDGNYTYGRGVNRVVRHKGTSPVGTFPPNARGLCDMHGNAWQWCSDIYDDYPTRPVADPASPAQSGNANEPRVLRGGSWDGSPQACRSARRGANAPVDRASNIGFRIALETR
jgi:formylglycine-generating enzyme required for sulfatase activity